MKRKLLILTSLICTCGILIYLSCGRDCPTCPKEEEPPELGHYRIYAYSQQNKFLMSIDTPADTIVDSIRVPFTMGYGVYATPEGSRVLVTNTQDLTMEIYDATDLSHIGTSDQYGDYFFDATDNYGICIGIVNERLYRIDPMSLSPLDSIDCHVEYGYLDTVNNLFFGVNGEADSLGNSINHNIIFEVDCETMSLLDSIVVGEDSYAPTIMNLAYNWLTGDLYFHAWQNGWPFFFQYDIQADSIVHATRTTYPLGSVSVSPDGRSVYMTDGGDGSHGIWPAGYIYIFDPFTHEVKELVSPYVFQGGDIEPALFGQIILTPDNRRAYIGSNINAWGDVPIVTVDLVENKMINAILPFSGFWAESIAHGPVPDFNQKEE